MAALSADRIAGQRRLVSRAPGAWSVQSRSLGERSISVSSSRRNEIKKDAAHIRYVLPRRASSRSASLAARAPRRRGGFALLTFARGFFFRGALRLAAGVLRRRFCLLGRRLRRGLVAVASPRPAAAGCAGWPRGRRFWRDGFRREEDSAPAPRVWPPACARRRRRARKATTPCAQGDVGGGTPVRRAVRRRRRRVLAAARARPRPRHALVALAQDGVCCP